MRKKLISGHNDQSANSPSYEKDSYRDQINVISMDALVQKDLELMRNMPAFHYLLENGSYVKDFRSIYPTLTYPCHTTMSTGCYPCKHGITSNE